MSGRVIRRIGRRIGLGVVLAVGVIAANIGGAPGIAGALAPQDPQVPASSGGVVSLPIRVVNGHLIVLTDLVGFRYTNEASFEISLEYPDALTLHPDQYDWLSIPPGDVGLGDGPQVRLLIQGGGRLSIPAKDVVPERSADRVAFQNSMTKLHSKALGERKLKGTIGIGLLRRYFVSIDVAGKRMILAPPREPSPRPEAASDTVDVTLPFEYVNNRVQVSSNVGDDRRGIFVVGGTNYDTFIDTRVVKTMGKPAGDVSPVWLADQAANGRRIDVSQYLAFRPKPFGLSATPGADSPLVITGVNFLENFQVDLDWVNQRMGVTQRKAPVYPKTDFLFFEAESRGTPEALEAFLQAHPDSRLGQDAADLLIRKRLEQEGSTDAEVMKALSWAIRTTPADRRIETCLTYVEMFDKLPNRTSLAIAAGDEGLKYSREAFDARTVYAMHHRIGQLEMKRQEWDEAWKHLLSAAFMAPDDLNVILDLARVYDKQGEVRRAYARYKRLSVAPGAPPDIAAEIKAAMERLRKQLPKDDPLLRDEAVPVTGRGRGGGGGRNER